MTESTSAWIDVIGVAELERIGQTVVEHDGTEIVVFWHDGRPVALLNACIHKQRPLSKGVILNGRVICPGHQWAFDLDSGYCEARDRCQPTFDANVEGERVRVDVTSRTS